MRAKLIITQPLAYLASLAAQTADVQPQKAIPADTDNKTANEALEQKVTALEARLDVLDQLVENRSPKLARAKVEIIPPTNNSGNDEDSQDIL